MDNKSLLLPLVIVPLLLKFYPNDPELQYDDHVQAYTLSLWQEVIADRMDTVSED